VLLGLFVHGRERNAEVLLDGNPQFQGIDTVEPKAAVAFPEKGRVVVNIFRSDIFKFQGLDNHFLNLMVQI